MIMANLDTDQRNKYAQAMGIDAMQKTIKEGLTEEGQKKMFGESTADEDGLDANEKQTLSSVQHISEQSPQEGSDFNDSVTSNLAQLNDDNLSHLKQSLQDKLANSDLKEGNNLESLKKEADEAYKEAQRQHINPNAQQYAKNAYTQAGQQTPKEESDQGPEASNETASLQQAGEGDPEANPNDDEDPSESLEKSMDDVTAKAREDKQQEPELDNDKLELIKKLIEYLLGLSEEAQDEINKHPLFSKSNQEKESDDLKEKINSDLESMGYNLKDDKNLPEEVKELRDVCNNKGFSQDYDSEHFAQEIKPAYEKAVERIEKDNNLTQDGQKYKERLDQRMSSMQQMYDNKDMQRLAFATAVKAEDYYKNSDKQPRKEEKQAISQLKEFGQKPYAPQASKEGKWWGKKAKAGEDANAFFKSRHQEISTAFDSAIKSTEDKKIKKMLKDGKGCIKQKQKAYSQRPGVNPAPQSVNGNVAPTNSELTSDQAQQAKKEKQEVMTFHYEGDQAKTFDTDFSYNCGEQGRQYDFVYNEKNGNYTVYAPEGVDQKTIEADMGDIAHRTQGQLKEQGKTIQLDSVNEEKYNGLSLAGTLSEKSTAWDTEGYKQKKEEEKDTNMNPN